MNKQQAKEKLVELEQKVAELRAIIDKPTVKPLFPKSWEEGVRFMVDNFGNVVELYEHSHSPLVESLALQGRTFYTREAAETFAKRERARAYCLERINEVNGGDNGYYKEVNNYFLYYNYIKKELIIDVDSSWQALVSNEYIRTEEAAEQLINDPEFVEQWKIWKEVKGWIYSKQNKAKK